MRTTVVADLQEGMILGEDILSTTEVLLASKGQEVNQSMIVRLENFSGTGGIRQPFTVLIPMNSKDQAINPAASQKAA
ncbi:MAG: hypothetical protein QM706_06155 [Nitrospira sp.]